MEPCPIASPPCRTAPCRAYHGARRHCPPAALLALPGLPPALREKDPKRVYYLSMEFLMGRSLLNTLYNLDIKDSYQEALTELG